MTFGTLDCSPHTGERRASPFGVDAEHRPVVRAVPEGRQRAAAASHRDQGKRKTCAKHSTQDRRKPYARVGNRNEHNGSDHPQPANTLHLDVRHVDQRG
jgi:hypothetical protein